MATSPCERPITGSSQDLRTPEAADARALALGRDVSVIPPGPYCYRPKGEGHVDASGRFIYPVEPCPYWAIHPEKEYQENGYCAWMGEGDWSEGGFMILWDQVKACGINDDFEDMDEEVSDE